MRIFRIAAVAVLLALPGLATAAETIFPGSLARPNNKGDQVIFYYDVRDGFTSFINLRSEAASELRVEVLYYSGDFASPFRQTVILPAVPGESGAPGTGGLVIIDVGALRAGGLPAAPGIAIATGVDGAGQAIVTRGLTGNFTVAHLATGSAWGSPGAARSAIVPPTAGADACDPKAPAAKIGTVIDGSTLVFTPIQPGSADLTAYYDPATLAANEVIFASFVDVPGTVYGAAAAATHWNVDGVRANGAPIHAPGVEVRGVVVSDLATVAGAGVAGSSGGLTFAAAASSAPLSRFVFFTQTLGTFSTGYLLPRK